MQDQFNALDELEMEDFDAGVAGEQEGYMTAENSYEFEADGFDPFDRLVESDNRFNGEGDGFADLSGSGEFESEYEFEFEGEGDEFFGKIWSAAKKVGKLVAPLAKKFAPQIGSVIGGALGGPAGAAIGGKLGGFVQQMEAEDEGESEDEMNAVPDVPATESQLAESVAAAASKGRPVEAQSLGSQITIFVGARAPHSVKTVLPVLSQASGDMARVLVARRDPRARALVRTIPTIQRRTVATLTRKAQTGKPVTPKVALRVMAKHAQRTLSNPQAITKALADNASRKRQLDKRAIGRAERR